MGGRLFFCLFVISILLLVVAKTILIVHPTFFHALDHEKVENIVVGSLACLTLLDLAYSLLACGNVCATTTTLLFVLRKYNLNVETILEHCHHIPIPPACILLGVICEIGSMIYSRVHNRQTRSNINVYNFSSTQPTHSTPIQNSNGARFQDDDDSTGHSKDVSQRIRQKIKSSGQSMPGNKTTPLDSVDSSLKLVSAEIHRPPQGWIQDLRKSWSDNEMEDLEPSDVHLETGTLLSN